jgi:hypothetical protein
MGGDIMSYFCEGSTTEHYYTEKDEVTRTVVDNKQVFDLKPGVTVKIGDFEIKSEDLGRLLERLVEKEMPELLV